MFCVKCGAKNIDGTVYCENCGARIAPEVQPQQAYQPAVENPAFNNPQPNSPAPAPKKPMTTKSKVILTIVIILAIAATAFWYVGKSIHDPEKIADKYVQSIVSGDYGAAYDCMNFKESEFINKETFIVLWERMESEVEGKYTIDKTDSDEDSITYAIECDGEYDGDLLLTKQEEKSWFIFDTYKVECAEFIAENFRITVPSDAELKIEGKVVDKKYIDNKSASGDEYLIPKLFSHQLIFEISTPYSEVLTKEIYVDTDGSSYITELPLSDGAKEELSIRAENFVKEMVNAAINKEEFNTLSEYFSSGASLSSIESEFDYISEKAINDEGEGIKSVTFVKFETTSPVTYNAGGNCRVRIKSEYNYTAMRKEYGSDVVEEFIPENTSNSTSTIYFVYENGEWKVDDLSMSIYLYY